LLQEQAVIGAVTVILKHAVGEPVLIDWSAGLPASAPAAREYLERDVKNLCAFFKADAKATLQRILS